MQKNVSQHIQKEFAQITHHTGVYIVQTSVLQYKPTLEATLHALTVDSHLSGIYVTMNGYTASTIRFKNAKANPRKLFVIDFSGSNEKGEGYFPCKTRSLTELSLALTEASNTGTFSFVLFDSISSLLLYHPLQIVQKFLQFTLSRMSSLQVSSVLFLFNDAESEKLFAVASQFSDHVIQLNSKEKK